MSNNLRQIAKDLRSFVKRCKDVHYSDSLLITFLVTGLLTTFAPTVIRADVAEEQQEVSVEAYDSITDLRQSFIRARKENKKALRGANAELAQLLKQGDQVIKSPWASFQFGTGYTNNDWGTTYKGRGGKKLEYYSGGNDLTKYVFDASKHQYGATNLNVARNEEPNTLAINPANIHEPYKPYKVDKLDPLSLPTAPEYTYALESPAGANQRLTPSNNFTHTRRQLSTDIDRSEFSVADANHNNTYTYYTNTSNTIDNAATAGGSPADGPNTNTAVTAASATAKATFEVNATPTSKLYDSRRWWTPNAAEFNSVSKISGGSFKDLYTESSTGYTVNGFNWWRHGGYVEYKNITVTDDNGDNVLTNYDGYDDNTGRDYTSGATYQYTVSVNSKTDAQRYAAFKYMEDNNEVDYATALSIVSNDANGYVVGVLEAGTTPSPYSYTRWQYVPGGVASPGTPQDVVPGATGFAGQNATKVWQYSSGGKYNHTKLDTFIKTDKDLTLDDMDFTIATTNTKNRSGVVILGGATTIQNGSTFTINDSKNAGVVVGSSGTLRSYNTTYNVKGGGSAQNIGISNDNETTLTGDTMTVLGGQSNGIVNKTGKTVSIIGGTYTVGDGTNPSTQRGVTSNLVLNDGTLSIEGGTFKIDTSAKNATIITNKSSATKVEAKGASFTVSADHATGIKSEKLVEIKDLSNTQKTSFTVSGNNSIGIRNDTGGTLTIHDSGTYEVSGTNSNLIQSVAGVTVKATNTTSSTFTASGYRSNVISNSTGGDVNIEKGTFNVDHNESNGIIATAGNIKTEGSHFYVNGNNSNAINNQGSGNVTVDYDPYANSNYAIFNIGKDKDNNITSRQYSNGIYTKGGILSAKHANFTIHGTNTGRNNGILIASGASGAHVLDYTSFDIQSGAHSNGLRIEDGASLNVTNSSFKTKGNFNNGIYADKNGIDMNIGTTRFEINDGSYSNAIFAKSGKINLTYGNIGVGSTAGGTNSNGIYLVSTTPGGGTGTDKAKIIDTTINVNTPNRTNPNAVRQASNNGIYIGGGRTISEITRSTINVNGNTAGDNNNIGIVVGNTSAQAEITKTENLTITLDTTNAKSDTNGTGIYMYNGNVTLGKATKLTGSGGNDVFVTIRNRDYTNTLTMDGDTGSGNSTGIVGTGANNIGINIQNGDNIATFGKKVTITQGANNKGWNISLTGGDNNTGILNNAFADEFVLSNKVTTTPVASGDLGVIRISGDKGVGFANLGYVNKSDDLRLDYVSMNGVNSAIMAFINHTYNDNVRNNTLNSINKSTVQSGVLNLDTTGTGKKLFTQGIIGADTDGGLNSESSVGIYANTGQRSDFTKGVVGFTGTDPLSNLDFGGLNIGLGQKANNSTVIWSENGTKVVVSANSYTTNSVANLVSDGAEIKNATSSFGYNVSDGATSKGSVFAYATGKFDGGRSGYYNLPDGLFRSEIDTTAVGVDLVSREGTALLATKGGKVTSGNVRAGGYRSILGYADGRDGVNNSGQNSSSILIQGEIVAADNNLLNSTVNDGNGQLNGLLVSADSKLENTYQNIGAVAIDGGSVVIEKAGRSTSSKEGATNAAVAPNSSLIYGMAAYARGTVDANTPTNKITSSVTFSKDSTKKASVTVISGEHGALFAEKNGQIRFAGDIINQNNVGPQVATKTKVGSIVQGVTGVDTAASVLRNGRGNNVGVSNDHTNTTPFYVNRGAYEGRSDIDNAGITFNDQTAMGGYTNIDMYDGILLSGNVYGRNGAGNYDVGKAYELIRDYYAKDTIDSDGKYNRAKYRGMENVKAAIMNDDYAVQLGIINQPSGKLMWNDEGNTHTAAAPTGTASYLDSIGKYYAEGMQIQNKQFATTPNKATGTNTKVGNRFKSTILNGHLVIDATTTNLEDVKLTSNNDSAKLNDPFNDISMESTIIEINANKEVIGDVANGYRAGQGLSMANSLRRWRDVNDATGRSFWEKTSADQSGIINSGEINVWGGTRHNNTKVDIAGMDVIFGTAQNKSGAKIKVDHGYGIFATDSSNISNSGEITISGKYTNNGAALSTLRSNRGFLASAETTPSGENYGIVGISDARATYDKNADESVSYNKIDILNINGKIKVEGDLAVGIYAENRSNALRSDINVTYNDTGLSKAGIDVQNPTVTNADARGVGIAVVNNNRSYNAAISNTSAGGRLTLNGRAAGIGTFGANNNNILTGKNGVGIFAEASNITLDSNTFTVETQDNGVGLWGMDATNVAVGTNSSHQKKFQYNYNGAKDKNGFAMAFGSRNNSLVTTARNDLDILFSNKADDTNKVNLVTEKNNINDGTSKGIAGILVNTGEHAQQGVNDTVINYGNIEEHSSSITNLRAYGAVVNRGNFINWGDIKLNESLMPTKASEVTAEDMKKVNVGIRANNMDRYSGSIEHHGDIKIGDTTSGKGNTTSARNIGSWAIYGHNITTGEKADGTNSVFVVNRNSYGIYSGDGEVSIKRSDIKVGNDTVLGHIQPTGLDADGNPYTLTRQQSTGFPNGYANPNDLLTQLGRERDSAIGVYIDSNKDLSNKSRTVNISANMEIDRFSHGIVLAERTGGRDINNITRVKIGEAGNAPVIKLAYSTDNNAGGHVKSIKPTDNPARRPLEIYEQGNSVYYYSADDASDAETYANVTMDGDYNTAYFTRGSVTNYGNIDLRSEYDLNLRNTTDPTREAVGYGNVGIISENTKFASVNRGVITTGLSDTVNMMYSVGMGAGRNYYRTNKNEVVYDRTEGQGYVINEGVINVQEKAGIGMLATGRGSKAINKGTINLVGENSIGMYIDREAVGENYGTIKGNAQNLKGVIAINGGFIKNYGTIDITGTGSTGIITDSSKFVTDANGKPVFDANGNPTYITDETKPEYATAITAGQANGKTAANKGANDGTGTNDFYGTHNTDGVVNAVGSETSIEEGSSGNPKTTGVGTTIKMPDIVPLTQVTIDGVLTPITNIDTDARNIGDYANNITLRNSIQSGGTRIIDLSTRDEFGNRAWPRYRTEQTSEVTTIGMYVDTSGVRYTNPYNGIQNLTSLGKVNLYFGPEATMYTNAKAIRFGDIVHDDGTIEQSNILKPFNDALRLLPGGSTVDGKSASLTWQAKAVINDNNQVTEVVMSKVPYHSFAQKGDESTYNFANNLDNLYEIAKQGSSEKAIFNTLNSFGNGQGHLLAQAFDQMRGHIYGGIQQRINATSNLLTDELAQLRREGTASKDSNKIKAFGRREEYKTDTAGIPDWHSNAGGFIYQHEDETVKLGDRSGWYAGAVNNYFTFRDLARSYENQAMLKAGLFKQTPLDEDGTLTFTIGGDAFIGKTNTKRRYTIGDVENLKEYRAKSDYYSYGADINAKLEKEFRLTEGFSIVPNLGLDTQYGRFSTINEEGDMALKIKSNDYYSIKPNAGVDFRYAQPVFKKSNFVASLGLTYETELGRLSGVKNEAQIKGAWTDYYTIKGDKENRKGNFKSDLNLGLDNGRLGFTVNTGYETKGHNFKAGLGLRVLF
ncbi:autotransporter-associated N-terminal domain-containing protein [Leptotrichia buccalis]